jgi:di- and tripeptidase
LRQVYGLDTYERRKVIQGHKGSVLGLCLSQDKKLLFSSATDPIVNVSALVSRYRAMG